MEFLTSEDIEQRKAPILEEVGRLNQELAQLDELTPNVECWEVRYCSVSDRGGKVFHTFPTKTEANTWVRERDGNAVFGYLKVVPRLLGSLATEEATSVRNNSDI